MIYDDSSPIREIEQPRRKQNKKGKANNWDMLYMFSVDLEEEFEDEDDIDYQRKKKARRIRRDRDEE